MRYQQGFTLIELMIAVAILALISSIAIPVYNGYVIEAQLASARANADSLRLFMEDYQLDNATYIVGGDTSYTEAELQTNFGWSPDGDRNSYTYTVDVTTNSWNITVEHTSSGNWMRYEDRAATYCDVDTSGASKTACP